MLSRSAEDLYWMARYMERAENAARVLDVSNRMSAVPTGDDSEAMHWRPALKIGPDPAAFDGAYGETTRANVITFMALDRDNPSSIWSCVQAARAFSRAAWTHDQMLDGLSRSRAMKVMTLARVVSP